ncbi:MAG: Urease accessory protein UreE [Chroococcidiopsis cubana SAG 39.79]|jgi:urease accessory protein|uniref:Urease accessory protein UreE n=2 Tax=Chroococcidiopsis TaxID=54298 RepID=K9U810_CHRTP|nr:MULTISPECIES: urease accessory protein UreE [Chroococcidiopsis]MBE9017301.1 urease accessory protein UreE [Chroococcidiopsidales cyanobacterium LEGE 13417]PSB49717.1 urease accessory protein UreE [Cyanosarcina cf. burmensis CCALA 770]AFY90359.1 UreE urease accessory domain-containing protein [Chroococcidiopsis thermalis PCC 7203]MDZ4878570.1 Urease accessory protein UreE [Chroococcidiopsis cubana SAG 39.79]PSB65998.1 urease accessory protein UreE [Chroococcidiopsis cubana CCALA 043]
MLTITDRLPAINSAVNAFTLVLTAEERTKSRHRFETEEGETVFLRLPRGTVLRDGDMLRSDNGEYLILVKAKSELVLTVTAATSLDLLRAAYHLGNRHVPLEIGTNYLRLSPDPVLQAMLEHLGVIVIEENAPFQPEVGAYGHH